MSFTNQDDWSSGGITVLIVSLGVVAVPLTVLMAIEGLNPFGFWTGWALVYRLICIASPLYAFFCLGRARQSNHRGEHRKAGMLLAFVVAPIVVVLALIAWVAVRQ